MALSELTYRGYTGSIETSIEDDCLHGRILFIDDLISYEGDTVPATRAAFQDAVDRYLAHCKRVGKDPNKPFSGTFNVRIGREWHSKAAKAAYKKNVKLNEFVKQAIQSAIETNGVISHEHHHQHQHDVTVSIDSASPAVTMFAGMGTPIWQTQDVELKQTPNAILPN